MRPSSRSADAVTHCSWRSRRCCAMPLTTGCSHSTAMPHALQVKSGPCWPNGASRSDPTVGEASTRQTIRFHFAQEVEVFTGSGDRKTGVFFGTTEVIHRMVAIVLSCTIWIKYWRKSDGTLGTSGLATSARSATTTLGSRGRKAAICSIRCRGKESRQSISSL